MPVITDVEQARADTELAVLSVMAHGNAKDEEPAARIGPAAQQAVLDLQGEHGKLYNDLIFTHLSEGARKALNAMAIPNYQYQSEFARRYFAEGMAEGKAEGKTDLLKRQLARRFGPLPASATARLAEASVTELDAIAERVLTAQSLDEALNLR